VGAGEYAIGVQLVAACSSDPSVKIALFELCPNGWRKLVEFSGIIFYIYIVDLPVKKDLPDKKRHNSEAYASVMCHHLL
jgi:hypothetical protein